jgi:hypothetical protein
VVAPLKLLALKDPDQAQQVYDKLRLVTGA